MNKRFKNYFISWIVCFVLFNIVCFVTPNQFGIYNKFAGSFWTGYVFISIALVGHLIFSYFVLKQEDREKRILNTPVFIISIYEMAIMVIIGGACIVTPNLPSWIGIILCYVVFAISILLLVTTKSVTENTDQANKELNKKTSAYRNLVDEAEMICAKAKTGETKATAKKVYEALRYGESVSCDASTEVENEIRSKLVELEKLVSKSDKTDDVAEEVLLLVEKRNKICKDSKRKE